MKEMTMAALLAVSCTKTALTP